MEQSLFQEYVKKYFPGIVLRVVTTLNGEDRQPSYLFLRMLRMVLSIDGTWQAIAADNTNVAADIVAMDSQLPIKARPSLSKASGEIPKIGMELTLNERQLKALDVLVAMNADVSQIVAQLFADTPRAISGIFEQLEALFLQGLSTGVALNNDAGTGVGIRIDYGYLTANKSGVPVVWSNAATATPITDINNVITAASNKGKVISLIIMDRVTFNNARKSVEGKGLWATSIGNFGSDRPIPTQKQFLEAWQEETNATILIVDRSVTFEKNGVKTVVKPWEEGKVILTTSDQVGDLVWSELPEVKHKAAGVEYVVANTFILASKYVSRSPLKEITSSQALVVPVINNVDQIFQIDTKVVQG